MRTKIDYKIESKVSIFIISLIIILVSFISFYNFQDLRIKIFLISIYSFLVGGIIFPQLKIWIKPQEDKK